MDTIGHWAFAILMLGMPIYFILRFRLGGLCLGLLGLWILFAVYSEFFPINRPGWNPFDSPFMFVGEGLCYFLPWLYIYGLKVAIVRPVTRKKKPDDAAS
jgi:hypothetical protein